MCDNESEELIETLAKFYNQMRGDASNEMLDRIHRNFVETQQKVLEVVELRQKLEDTCDISQSKSEHLSTLAHVLAKMTHYEGIISTLVRKCHEQESQIMRLQAEAARKFASNKVINNFGALESIQQNVVSLKSSIIGHLQSCTQKKANVEISIATEHKYQISKEVSLSNRDKFLKLKSEMLEESEKYTSSYLNQLKQSLNLFTELLKIMPAKVAEVAEVTEVDEVTLQRNSEAQKTLRQGLRYYEKEMMQMKSLIEQHSHEIEVLRKQNTAYINERSLYEQKICKMKIEGEQRIVELEYKEQQLRKEMEALRSEVIRQQQEIRSYQQEMQKQQRHLQIYETTLSSYQKQLQCKTIGTQNYTQTIDDSNLTAIQLQNLQEQCEEQISRSWQQAKIQTEKLANQIMGTLYAHFP